MVLTRQVTGTSVLFPPVHYRLLDCPGKSSINRVISVWNERMINQYHKNHQLCRVFIIEIYNSQQSVSESLLLVINTVPVWQEIVSLHTVNCVQTSSDSALF